MKSVLFALVVVIILVLLYKAWRKETIKHHVPPPVLRLKKPATPQKAPKSRMPNTREEKCRDIFESLTGKAFPTVRPSFLKNPETGRNLELDGYCEELGVAFEYQGAQHYKFPNKYHKTHEEFFAQIGRDQFKVDRCAELGIVLIVVPYTLTDSEMYDYIVFRLQEERSRALQSG